MKILFFTDHFYPEPSAPAAHVYERARLWVEWGHSVTVITSVPNFPEGRVYAGYRNGWRSVESLDGIRVVRVRTYMARNEGFTRRTLDYASYMCSSGLLAHFEARPDVVISTSPHLFVPLAGVTYSLSRRIPHVFELRDLWPATIRGVFGERVSHVYRLLELCELWLYRKSSRIICLTNSFAADLQKRGIPADKMDVILNGANLDLFSPRPRDAQLEERYALRGQFVVGYLGTIGLSHGLENVLEAAALLHEEPITFLFVGAGAELGELSRVASERGLDNVIFTGRQSREAMPAFWSLVDVSLIHLKNSEVFKTVVPSKIFESMAMGLPILYVGPSGEGSEIVRKHCAGVIITPDDPHALSREVHSLRENAQLCQTMAASSLEAAPLYSRQRQAELTLSALNHAIQVQDVKLRSKSKSERAESR